MKSKRHILKLLAVVVFGVACIFAWILWFRPPSTREINSALAGTIIPKLSFRDAPYSEAVAFVLQQVRSRHPEFEWVRFISHFPAGTPSPSPNDPYFNGKVTLELSTIPANHALQYIAEVTSLRYTVRDGAIYFYSLIACDGRVPPMTIGEQLTTHANNLYWRVHAMFN